MRWVKEGGGFTLVEVMVALVVLEVGLLGVVGTLWLAARTLTEAEALERGVAEVERVYDSLSAGVAWGDGGRPLPSGSVRWWRTSGGGIRIEYSTPRDSALVTLAGRVPGGAGA